MFISPRLPLSLIATLLLACFGTAHADTASSPQTEAIAVAENLTEADAELEGESDTEEAIEEDVEERDSRIIYMGEATQSLLAMQRASKGQYPRPIDGEQASRSYQRYLKSFETKIPERFETGIKVTQ